MFLQVLKAENVAQFEKYYTAFQGKGVNEHKLEFSGTGLEGIKESEGYLCAGHLSPLRDRVDIIRCPLDLTTFDKAFQDKTCPTCQLTCIGRQTVGLNTSIIQY